MYILILRISAHRKNILLSLFASIGMFLSFHVLAEVVKKSPTPDEIRQANERLPAALAGQPDLSDDTVDVIKLEKKLHWSSDTAERLLLLPVSIRYKGSINSYCRLVTASVNFKDMTLVKLPPQANFDDCIGISNLIYMDVNDDGLLDVIEGVRVKSNAGSYQVAVPLVYLSNPTSGSGYCYSNAASQQLIPTDLRSDETIREALDAAKKRVGGAAFECVAE